jgi:glucokinase
VSRTLAGWAARRNGHGEPAAPAEPIGADAVYAAARTGDEVALAVTDAAGRAIAWGIHLLALAYDVERIVIGGGVSHAGDAFMAPVQRELDRYRASSALAAEILQPDLVQLLPAGADAGAWGAVTIARQSLERREVGHA